MIGIMLAAGRGTRMKSEVPKVLFEVNDEPMCFSPLKSLLELCDHVIVVVGYQGEDVKSALLKRASEVLPERDVKNKLHFFTQSPPRGTGDAVRVALEGYSSLGDLPSDDCLVLNGDLPLIRKVTLEKMIKTSRAEKLTSACLSLRTAQPKGLGRILRDGTGIFTGIREEKDASSDERRINEINGGVYYFNINFLKSHITQLNTKNSQAEFYLTDLLGNTNRTQRSSAILIRNPYDLMGVNTTLELSGVRKIAQFRLQQRLCEDFGIEFKDPATAYISARTQWSGASVIGPNVVIRGNSSIHAGAVLDGNNFITNSSVGPGAHILWGSVLTDSKVGAHSSVGPMAHLRPGSVLEEEVKIGNFVELKKTTLKKGAKASHLSYLGDATVGENSNIGCGTITCNYDGFNKHSTVIGQRAFIGSDTQLIAPLSIGDDAYVGSGTTVTGDVPAGALALSRPVMIVKEGYAKKLSDRLLTSRKKGQS
jgi:bifunctional UDP-N-acetylglucosamine pyrophosphorylase/glucosamine-1-phosphate N-acetyltransferase